MSRLQTANLSARLGDAPWNRRAVSRLLSWIVTLCIAAPAVAYDGTPPASLEPARDNFLHGRYDEALAYLDHADRAKNLGAVCSAAYIERMRGKPTSAIERLETLADKGKNDPQWQAEMALALIDIGRSEDALRHGQAAVRADGESLSAQWALGQVYEARGDIQSAIRAYSIFDFKMTDEALPNTPEALTLLGRGFYRYTILTQTNLVARIRHLLREVYQEAFDYLDKDYWPARLAAAHLLADRDNQDDARAEFEAVLAINPNVPDALVGIGRTFLADWRFEELEEKANAALVIDAEHVGARLLLAQSRMVERRFAEAKELAEKALQRNPESTEALGLLAAAEDRLGNEARIEELLQRCKRFNQRPGAFYLEVGKAFSAARQYEPAAQWLKRAAEAWHWHPIPQVELGLLYLESGREAEARPVLEKAFALDSFNERTYRVLDLLDRLEKFDTHETDHFVFKFKKGDDRIAVEYMADMLESCYGELVTKYGIDLKQKTIIEIFPSHDGFSLRIAHRGFIATIGACTGPVIAMLTPRGQPPFGHYNWADVLRHEFVHTVTLAATQNRIPHWMTEGLAVLEEPGPRSWGRMDMLTTATRREKLFTLENIVWGFWRPPFPGARAQAYAQSEWMMEYIIERFGGDKVGALLKAFDKGQTQEAAFRDVLDVETTTFDKDFAVWALKQVDSWGLPWMQEEDVEPLRKQCERGAPSAELLGRLARAEFVIGESERALIAAQTCLAKEAGNLLALEVTSRLFIMRMLAATEEVERATLLQSATPFIRRWKRQAPDNALALKYMAYVEQGNNQLPEAIVLLKKYQARHPLDPDSYRRLAAIYTRRDDKEALRDNLQKLLSITREDLQLCGRLAKLQLEAAQWEDAIVTLELALQIDPFNAEIHGALADAYAAVNRLDAALREYETVTKLAPTEALGFEGMADMYSRKGDAESARRYRERAAALGGKQQADPIDDKNRVPAFQ